jgi:hypothetical protein
MADVCQVSEINCVAVFDVQCLVQYRGADKSLARPERKQTTATEDFGVCMFYLLP